MFGVEFPLLLSFCLIVANAVLVATQIAIVKVRRTYIESLAQRGSPLARMARKVLRNLDRSLVAVHLGISVTSLGLGWVGGPAVARLLEPLLTWAGVWFPTLVYAASLLLAFAILVLLHITVGTLLPKLLAVRKPHEVALWTSPLFWLFFMCCYPLLWLLNACANGLVRLFGLDAVSVHEFVYSEEELRVILAASHRHGVLTASKRNLLENVLDLAERSVMEIMLPRPDIDYLSLDKSWEDNLDTIYRTGHTRYPLCETDIDHVVGMVHIKDIFLQKSEVKSSADLLKIKRDVLFVPETRPVDALQQDFQQRRLHMAIVVDEYGSTAGLVTLEDVLEELVGEIQDEFDAEPPKIEHTPEGITLDGHTPLTEVIDLLELPHVEVRDTHTIGGYVHAQLGRIARIGDTVSLNSHLVKVLEMNGRRITRVLITPSPSELSLQAAASDQ